MARALASRSKKVRSTEIKELRRRLQEAEETLSAITSGEVDALVVTGQQGEQVYTLRDADWPYRALIEQMSEGALTLNGQGVVLFANACFAAMMAADLEAVLAVPLARWVAEKDQAAYAELFKTSLGENARGEIELVDRFGDRVPVDLSLHRLLSDDGSLLVTAVAYDLRERKRSIDSLRAALLELDTSLAELHASNEELRGANKELASTRRAVEEERQRYADLFDFAPDGYLVTDSKAVVREANRAAAEQLNVPLSELIRAPLVLFVGVHDRRAFLSELVRLANSARDFSGAALLVTMQPPDRKPFTASVKIGPIRDENELLTGLRWLIRDVSDLVQAERDLRQLNAQLELRVQERTAELETANLFLQSEIEERKRAQAETQTHNRELSVLYAISRAAGESIDLRGRLEAILGTAMEALELEAGGIYLLDADGETMVQHASRGHSPEFSAGVARLNIGEGVLGRAIAANKPIVLDVSEYPTERLAPIWVREGLQTIAAVPILWREHVLGGVNLSSRSPRSFSPEELQLLTAMGQSLGVWVRNARLYEQLENELTERKRAEQTVTQLNRELEWQKTELQVTNRQLESFSYSVSHDLRTPLAAMDGFTRLLEREYAAQLPDQARPLLHLIEENAAMMQRLINDLLAFSRSGRSPLNKQRVAPGEIAAQASEELRGTCDNRQVEIDIREMPTCAVDPALLKQVYINLLSNAIKFTRKRPIARIEVGSKQCEGEDCPAYFVRDNGVGFDPERAERLFGVFQRLHSEEEYEGTGVGLAIVERIIKRHGGRVWADAAVDQGATFYFTLP